MGVLRGCLGVSGVAVAVGNSIELNFLRCYFVAGQSYVGSSNSCPSI